ncbi:hypothetical protein [Rossellomorea vietnamensis]|uniref:hypothetical protein n=1 Tax=Rossellomorea vietnamensis TaxID=218284 RepID=UPI0020787EB8|nr:hypothetical protein [Rossellomorea vietnamensis]
MAIFAKIVAVLKVWDFHSRRATPRACGEPPRLCLYIKWSALLSPDRQMFSREKKAGFPFILLRLFDPEGLGAATRLGVSPAR